MDISKYVDSITMRNYLLSINFFDSLSSLEKCAIISHSEKTSIEEKERIYNNILGEDEYNRIKIENPDLDNEWRYGYFEKYYLYIPSPFHPGDLIKNTNTGEIGILTHKIHSKEEDDNFIKNLTFNLEASDMQYRINYFFERKSGITFINHRIRKVYNTFIGHDHWDILHCENANISDLNCDNRCDKLLKIYKELIDRNLKEFNPDDITGFLELSMFI